MSLPRVLVVRSGANPFIQLAGSSRVEIVEKVSHAIEPVRPAAGSIEGAFGVVVFTSQVAVERAFGDAALSGAFREAVSGASLAAVGSATGDALASRGLKVDLVAGGSAESILEHLPPRMDGQRVLLPCGEDAAAELPSRLRARGAEVARLVLYRKVPNPFDPGLEREILERPFAAFCVTSPSAGSWLFGGIGREAAQRLRGTPAVVLGRFTRRLLESHGVRRIELTPEARFDEAVAMLEQLATEPVGT